MSVKPIDWRPYENRPRRPDGKDYDNMVDLICFDHLPPEVRKAIREFPAPIMAAQTYAWMLKGATPAAVVSFVNGAKARASAEHRQFMDAESAKMIAAWEAA